MPKADTHYGPGYALVEALVVVVILGLIVAVLLPRMAVLSDGVRHQKEVAQVVHLDGHARQVAQARGGLVLSWDQENHEVQLVQLGTEDLVLRTSPLGIDTEVTITPMPLYDAMGRSQDYSMQVSSGGRVTLLRFSGRTGWCEVLRHED